MTVSPVPVLYLVRTVVCIYGYPEPELQLQPQ